MAGRRRRSPRERRRARREGDQGGDFKGEIEER